MKRHILRIILIMVLLITLCATATISVYAGDGQKQKAHGAGKVYCDLSQLGPDWSGADESHINFTFNAPDDGYYKYRTFDGPWAGSWGIWEIKGLAFGTYSGTRPDIIPGSSIVVYWGQCVAGESFTNLDYPGLPPWIIPFLVPYQNIEGWYKLGVWVDGGPGHENDYGLVHPEIPPEGNPFFPFYAPGPDAGLTQVQAIFNAVVNGDIEFGGGIYEIAVGNVNIK